MSEAKPDVADVAKELEEVFVQRILDLKVEQAFRLLLRRITPILLVIIAIGAWFGYDLKTTGDAMQTSLRDRIARIDAVTTDTEKKLADLTRIQAEVNSRLARIDALTAQVHQRYGEIGAQTHEVARYAEQSSKSAMDAQARAAVVASHAENAKARIDQLTTLETQAQGQAQKIQDNDRKITDLVATQERITASQRLLLPFLFSDLVILRSNSNTRVTLPDLIRGGNVTVYFETPDIERRGFEMTYAVNNGQKHRFTAATMNEFVIEDTAEQYRCIVGLFSRQLTRRIS